MILLAIDPGHSRKDKGLGWASFELPTGKLLDFGQILPEDLPDLLRNLQPGTIVYETYRNRPWQKGASNWSDNKESQIIGGLQMYAAMAGHPVDVIGQSVDNMKIGQMWSGIKVPKDHALSHQCDAYGHGVYYIVQNGYRTIPSYHEKEVKI